MKELALTTPIILLAASFASLAGIVLPGALRVAYAVSVFSIAQLLVTVLVIAGFAHTTLMGGEPLVYMFGGWPLPLGIVYVADSLSFTIALLVSLTTTISIAVFWLSRGSPGSKILFQAFALVVEAGLLGVLFTADFFHLFVMWEVVSVASVGLAVVGGLDRRVVRAAFRYVISSSLVVAFYMFIVAITVYGSYGTLSIPDYIAKSLHSAGVAMISGGVAGSPELASGLLLASVVLAFGLSAGLFPLHFWMPDLYERISTPVAILLAGGKEVVAVYVVARMLYTVHSSHPYAGEALATVKVALFALGLGGVVYGALAILARQSFRRMLAYYLVMDAGIIFVVLSAGGPRAIEAFVYLALSHVVLSIALFSLCDILESPQAIGRPLLATAGALVAAGAPPFSSFFGKLLALLALLDKPASLALFAASVVVSSLAPLIAILRASSEQRDSARMWVLAQLLLASLSVVASLALGIGVFWLRELVLEPVAIEAIDYQSYIEPALERAREIYDRYWPRD